MQKLKQKSVEKTKINYVDVTITKFKKKIIPKAKCQVGNLVRYLLEQPKYVFDEKFKGNFLQGDLYCLVSYTLKPFPTLGPVLIRSVQPFRGRTGYRRPLWPCGPRAPVQSA